MRVQNDALSLQSLPPQPQKEQKLTVYYLRGDLAGATPSVSGDAPRSQSS